MVYLDQIVVPDEVLWVRVRVRVMVRVRVRVRV